MVGITKEMVQKRVLSNLDKDGKCKLASTEDFGHCLSAADAKYLVGTAMGVSNTNYVRPILYEANRQGHIGDATINKIPGYTAPGKSAKARNSLMARGTIWKSGVHQVFVNDKPASVFEPQYRIPETFKVFQDEIMTNGGIQLGLDHIPPELLKQYPMLAKMNPLDVGRITRIAHDNDAIYALESEHTNPLIQQLYDAGELPAYSIVADFNASPCETGQADYIIESFRNIKRTDYVDEGGCTDCKVKEDLPDDLVMTAKLSLTEDDNLSDDIELVEEVPQEELIEAENPTEEEVVVDTEEITEEEEVEEEEEEEESLESRLAKVEAENKELREAMDILAKKSEAVDEIQLQAKTSRVTGLIDAEIKAGKVLPKEKESLTSYGIEHEKELKEMLAARPVVVELDEQKSVHIDAKHGNKEYTYEDFEKEYKKE